MARVKTNFKFLVIAFLVLSISSSLFFLGISVGRAKAQDELESKLEIFLQVLDIVKNDFIERDVDNTKLIYGAIRGLLDSLDDPYTHFVEPKSYKEMKIRMSGSYSGVGIYIGMKDKQLVVISPIDDTPASKAGLKAGDKITSVDGTPTKGMSLEEAVSLIRGPKGSTVVLGIIRGKAKKEKEYPIVRNVIKIKSVKVEMLEDDIGYIKLSTFEKEKAAYEMKQALLNMDGKGAKGLILDVRGNGGGLLENALQISDMFMDKGVIVSTVDRYGDKESITASRGTIWDKPVVMLIDGSSASASEILAGALRDNDLATLVGTKTFGKASVQNVRQLDDGSAVLITVAKYLTPDGSDISKKGIEPDVLVEVPTVEAEAVEEEDMENMEETEEEDIQLNKAIDVLKEKIGKKTTGSSGFWKWDGF